MSKYLVGRRNRRGVDRDRAGDLRRRRHRRRSRRKVHDRLGEPGWHGLERRRSTPAPKSRRMSARMFDRLDTNRDGYDHQGRGDRRGQGRHGASIVGERTGRRGDAHFDHRGDVRAARRQRDGAISRAEFEAAHAERQQRRVAARDGNGDGRPDPGARCAACANGLWRLGGRMFEHGRRQPRRPGVAAGSDQRRAIAISTCADANRDGRLTPEERMQMHQRMRAERQPS